MAHQVRWSRQSWCPVSFLRSKSQDNESGMSRSENTSLFLPENYPQGLWNVETEPVEQNEQKFSFTGAVEKMRNLHTRAVEKKSLQA